MKMKYIYILISIFVLLFCAGCLSVKYQRADQYLLQIKTPQKLKTIRKKLKIQHVTVNQQFSGVNFVYRDSNIHYLIDYYHAFLIPPAVQIQQLIQQYLNATCLFDYVAGEGSFDKVDYELQTHITDLYADYRDKDHPKAVISIHFVLTNPDVEKNNILLNKIFHAAVPLKNKDTESLMSGWNQGLNEILKNFTCNQWCQTPKVTSKRP
ncbi:MAG: membrane integrity-associated transporter subunit PqiC [Gammaproteobacteria bacterium]|nr:membrane integrity-associated transporter subunit PqiC [Gammaproteobacteria bacterium]